MIKPAISLFVLSLLFLLISINISAQSDLEERLKDKIKDKTESAVEDAVDESIDNMTKKKESKDTKAIKKDDSSTEDTNSTETSGKENKIVKKTDDLQSYSKFDFIPGDKMIFFDDFSLDNVGDFPVKWNTNAGGEVVTLNKYPGKWFKMNYGGVFIPEFKESFPENFTIEYDAIYNFGDENLGAEVQMDIFSSAPEDLIDANVIGNGGCAIKYTCYNLTSFNWINQNYGDIDNVVQNNAFTSANQAPVRVSISVQKQRVRFYVGEKKLIDIPRLLPQGIKPDKLRFNLAGVDPSFPQFYFTNFRIAVGQADMRSKLISEGKLVIHGIYFDSGSDKIKPESYGTLKEIANVLNANPEVKVKIIGHTDSDGQDAANLELSKKRAVSVKNSLSAVFGISSTRLETDGKGESVPIDDNKTTEGKANNRRVEFIKL